MPQVGDEARVFCTAHLAERLVTAATFARRDGSREKSEGAGGGKGLYSETVFKDNDVIDGFEFNDGTRTFSCSVEGAHAAPRGAWWWFRVSTDDRHRYAPFQASPKDTRASVSSRVVAYYDDLMTRRAAPAASYWRRGAPAKPAVAATAPTEAVPEAIAEAS